MSDARAATDEEVALVQWRIENMPDTVPAPEKYLVARISADAARIRELEARQVPDGWQVVPKEPTSGMIVAGDAAERFCGMALAARVWPAMLAAAPRP